MPERHPSDRLAPRKRGNAWPKLAAVFVGLGLALVLCELGLRVAGKLHPAAGGRDGTLARTTGPVLLCCGDSNVYGLYEVQPATYPAHLQRLLDACTDGGARRVVNVGVPGLNSLVLQQLLPRDLERYRPEAVLLTVGANDFWGWTPEAAGSLEEPPWYERLALTRLWRLLQQTDLEPPLAAETGTPVVLQAGNGAAADGTAGAAVGPILRWTDREGRAVRVSGGASVDKAKQRCAQNLRANLEHVAELCREHGARLVLLGYGADRGIYAEANAVLARAATELGLPFVSTHEEVGRLAERLGGAEVYHSDDHPKGPGYEVIARLALLELVHSGAVAGPPFRDVQDGVAAPAPPRRELALSGRLDGALGGPDELAFELWIEGRAGFQFTILLLGRDLPPGNADFFYNLAGDELFVATLNQRPFRGVLDAAGHARLPVGSYVESHAAELAGSKLRAVYVVHRDADPRSFVELGPVQDFELR
jgi:lysophospholipase L1-like esterase